MDVKATLETRQSKAGNTYQVIVIKLTPDYEKMVFLDNAELELLKLSHQAKNNVSMPDMTFFSQDEVNSLK